MSVEPMLRTFHTGPPARVRGVTFCSAAFLLLTIAFFASFAAML